MTPTAVINPYTADALRDPYPIYAALRGLAPVVQTRIDGRDVWVLSHDEHIRAALNDYTTYSSVGGLSLHPREDPHQAGVLIATDPPEHTRLLKLVAPLLRGRALDPIREQVDAFVATLVGPIVARGSCEVVSELARRIPTTVVGDLIGLPATNRGKYTDAAHHATALQGPTRPDAAQLAARIQAMRRQVAWLADAGRLKEGSVGAKVWAAATEGKISRGEAISILWGALVVAGLHSTVGAMAAALDHVARNQAAWDVYRGWHAAGYADRRERWVDELLRHEIVFPHIFRTATVDTTVDGHTIPAGARVLLLPGSANRDPARWANPDIFDPTRDDARHHLAFGDGIHACLGRQLAYLEIGALLDALADQQVESLRVGDGEFMPTAAVRAWGYLPVKVTVGRPHVSAR